MVNGDSITPRILVVDDIPDTLELIANWLELHSFETIQATSGPQAIKLAQEEKPDLILLDVMMPKMDGIETCRQLKANPQTANIPVILVTAKDPVDARADGMFAGAVDYITKPVNLPDLVHKVENAIIIGRDAPVDVKRLLDEVAHTTLTITSSAMVWLLALNSDTNHLASQALATTSSSVQENNFLIQAGTSFPLDDAGNPMSVALKTRKSAVNLPIKQLNLPTTSLYEALQRMHLTYVTIVPLIAVGKTIGIMVLGNHYLQDMETPRAQQILSSFASQAAIAVDYSRLMQDVQKHETEQQNEQAFRQMILDTMSDVLVVIDASGDIKYYNQRLLRMTSYTPDDLDGQSVGMLFHPDDRHEVMVGLLRENAATMKFDQRIITNDSRVIPVLMSRSRSQSNPLDNQVIVFSDMTDQKERQDALERQTSRLVALNKASQVIASNLSLHDTLQDILDSAIQVVEAQGASLFLVNRDNNDELFVVAAVGYKAADLINIRVPMGQGLAGWVAREAQSALVADLKSDPRFYRAIDEQTGMDTETLIAVPLTRGEEIIGVIEVVNKLNGAEFDVDDLRLLESMAGTAAVSIINARLFDQSQRRVSELATLLGASETASSTLQLANVLENIVHNLATSLEVSHCILMSWNSNKNRLETLAEVSDVFWEDNDGPERVSLEGSASYQAIAERRVFTVSANDQHIDPADKQHLENNGMANMMILPIIIHNQVTGIATLYNNEPNQPYNPEHSSQSSALLERWQGNLTVTRTLQDISEPVISDLMDQLSRIDTTCWITIQHISEDHTHTRLIRETGFSEWTQRRGSRLAVANYPTMHAVIKDKQIYFTDLDMLPPDSEEREWLAYRGGQSCLMVPLISHGSAIGLVALIDISVRSFDNQEANLAQGIANVVSNAMDNARLYQSLQSRAKALESAYHDLQEADQAKDQFIQNISHELRTPLIHVLGYAELMADQTFGEINEEQREALRTIGQKAQQVADIVEDMVAAQAQDMPTLDRQPVDLNELIRQTIEANTKLIQESKLQIVQHPAESIPQVYANPDLITDAFNKLLSNALKFGGDGERVEIMIRDMDGPMVQVAIRDYGIGIDPSEQSKIFQRFYQVDAGMDRRYSGTGLGLAVAKSIIESHSGRIGLKSRLNEGSIFYFTLPKYDYMQR